MPVQQTHALPESIRVRCPHCRKLYLVQYNDIQESRPRFECVSCRQRFWISLGEMDFSSEVDGIPITAKEIPQPSIAKAKVEARAAETEPCPKCFKLVAKNSQECTHCGVVIPKYRDALTFKESTPAHSQQLDGLWQRILAAYDDEARHEEFIKVAQRERNLAYAAYQYAQMKSLMPTDDATARRVRQVQALSEMLLPPREERSTATRATRRFYPRVWQLPLLAGVLLLAVGISISSFRNLAGLGAAFLFLAVALKRFR